MKFYHAHFRLSVEPHAQISGQTDVKTYIKWRAQVQNVENRKRIHILESGYYRWWRFFNNKNAPWVGLVTRNYYRRRRPHDLHISLSGHVSHFWRGILKASIAFAFGTNIVAGNGCTTRFWLDHLVGNDTLASKYPNLFVVTKDHSSMINSQICSLDGRMIRAPLFWRWPNQFMRENLYNDLNSLLTIL